MEGSQSFKFCKSVCKYNEFKCDNQIKLIKLINYCLIVR